jgi:hypothetical protein
VGRGWRFEGVGQEHSVMTWMGGVKVLESRRWIGVERAVLRYPIEFQGAFERVWHHVQFARSS